MHYAILGIVLGLASGFSPGPLQTLVISQAVRYGWRSGATTALAPLVSDIVIVSVTVGIIGLVPKMVLSLISIVGALVVTYLAWETGKASREASELAIPNALAVGASPTKSGKVFASPTPSQSLWRAVVVNFLNPHAWLFWAVIGAPMTIRASHHHIVDGALFIAVFYATMVGSKIFLSILAARGVEWLGSKFQKWVLRGAAIGLMAVAIVLVVNGVVGILA
jgi:threonine/homoserine/homoserine lactone efflux protein